MNPEGYAKKYNIPVENTKNADFIETAKLKQNANFITREAGTAPGSTNKGKGIEIVVEEGGTTGKRYNTNKKIDYELSKYFKNNRDENRD